MLISSALITLSAFLSTTLADEKEDTLNPLRDEFQGINWDYAYDECKADQFDSVVKAVRGMSDVLDTEWSPDGNMFNRFFVRPNEVPKLDSWGTHSSVYKAIISNLKQVQEFPKRGPKSKKTGKLQKSKQVAIRCNDELKRCGDSRRNAAYTRPAAQSETELWTVVLCPRFFSDELKDLDKLVLGSYKKQYSIHEMNPIVTRETALIHELFHANVVGIMAPKGMEGVHDKSYIDDLMFRDPELDTRKPAYGPEFTHEFAWKDMGGNINGQYTGSVNPEVKDNADNYAIFLTFNYIQACTLWGWDKDDGSNNLKRRGVPLLGRRTAHNPNGVLVRRDDEDGNYEVEDEVDENEIDNSDLEEPYGCASGVEGSDNLADIICPYIGEEFPDFIQDMSDGNYWSEGGCKLDAKCMAFGDGGTVHPDCKCNCDNADSPITTPFGPAPLTEERCKGFVGTLPS